MTRNSETIQFHQPIAVSRALHSAVRRALHYTPLLSAAVIAAGVAAALPLASADPFPAEFPLSTLLPDQGGDGSAGFVLYAIYNQSGRHLSSAGDVNGDGVDDVVIGSPYADEPRENVGQAYVVFGGTHGFPAEFELRSLLPDGGGDGSAGFVLQGINSFDFAGDSVSEAGDVNGDGIGDVIIGAFPASPGGRKAAGQTYVVFGRDTAQVGNFPAILPLGSLLSPLGGDGSAGFVLDGIRESDVSAYSVSAAGDVNADGIDDLVIGAPGAPAGGYHAAGESYVVFGRLGGFPPRLQLVSLLPEGGGDGSFGFVLEGTRSTDKSGYSVGGDFDINGDGIDDIVIAAPYYGGQTGKTYVVFGRDTVSLGNFPATFELSSLQPGNGGDGSAGFVLRGISTVSLSGTSVGGAGDVNGDGVDDLLLGAWAAHRTRGESYVVFGRDTAQVGNFPAVFSLGNLTPAHGGDGSRGFVLRGIDQDDRSGTSVSAAGDVDGDGVDDLIIGAPKAAPDGRSYAGESYVVFGRNTAQVGNFPPVFELRGLDPDAGGDGSQGVVLTGIDGIGLHGDQSGSAVSNAGDFNGDGIDDFLIGAPLASPPGRSYSGESYIVFGRSSTQ